MVSFASEIECKLKILDISFDPGTALRRSGMSERHFDVDGRICADGAFRATMIGTPGNQTQCAISLDWQPLGRE